MTRCQTSGALFHIGVSPRTVSVVVDLPLDMELTEQEAELLDANLHNAVELALAAVWKPR